MRTSYKGNVKMFPGLYETFVRNNPLDRTILQRLHHHWNDYAKEIRKLPYNEEESYTDAEDKARELGRLLGEMKRTLDNVLGVRRV